MGGAACWGMTWAEVALKVAVTRLPTCRLRFSSDGWVTVATRRWEAASDGMVRG